MKKWIILGGAVVAAAVVAFVLYWFEPQALLTDKEVDEALPTVPTTPTVAETDGGVSTTLTSDPIVLASGEFVSRDHPTSGTASYLELTDGSQFLRLTDFQTDNGPDLFVYLSAAPVDAGNDDFDNEAISLGELKGNIGDQNYEIPADTDLSKYTTVVIWCKRFTVPFGAAALG